MASMVVPMSTLSFSSSVGLSDEKSSLRATVSRLCGSIVRGGERRFPLIVSPKAVSDSQNSQTCLDPDASSVSIFFLPLIPEILITEEYD